MDRCQFRGHRSGVPLLPSSREIGPARYPGRFRRVLSSAAMTERPARPRLYTFVGSERGYWQVTKTTTLVGAALPPAQRVDVAARAMDAVGSHAAWVLRGITSHERYVTQAEQQLLAAQQPSLGRPAATCAALIPIRKNAAWWALAQDERRRIFEEQSHHTAIGLEYLPAIARRLHHCRDLSESEPFDFLTWFEYAPSDEPAFDRLLAALRATAEWQYVDREIDIRLVRREMPTR